MALDAKTIKEEIPDKDLYLETQRRINGPSKERCKTPDSPEGARLVAPRSPASPAAPLSLLHGPCRTSNGSCSPHLNGSSGSPTPPPPNQLAADLQLYGQATQRPLLKVKRFLSTLVTFGQDISPDIGDRVRGLVLSLASTGIGVEEFQASLQDVTNFPLRPFVLPFLRAHLPLLQREVQALARTAKQTPLQYVRGHEHVVLDPSHNSAEAAEIFLPPASSTSSTSCVEERPGNTAAPILKRRASDAYHDTMSNGISHSDMLGEYPAPKRPHPSLLLNPSPLLMPVHQHQGPFEYQHFQPLGPSHDERRDSSAQLNCDQRNGTGDEWKNINTMLNCILSMVEKTKRALAILQQRGVPQENSAVMENSDIRRLVNEILSATVRQTEERVAEVKRRAEDAVNQVKRQAVLELQRAVSHAESKAFELVASERAKMEKMLIVHKQPADENHLDNQENSRSPPVTSAAHQNICWNCGRKANETCSGCNVARYCGSFCQHRDWETRHHQNCITQDSSKTALRLLPSVNNTSSIPNNPIPSSANISISSSNGKCVLSSGNTSTTVSSVLCGNNNQERIPPLKK